MLPAAHGKRGLLLRAEGDHTGRIARKRDRLGDIPAAAAVKVFPPLPGHHQGIVTTVLDGAVVQEKAIGNSRQPIKGFLVLQKDRLVGEVGAGHHQGVRSAGRPVQQENMQRRIGEHNPQAPVVAEICEVLRSFLFQQDNGAAYAFQKRSLRLRDPAE